MKKYFLGLTLLLILISLCACAPQPNLDLNINPKPSRTTSVKEYNAQPGTYEWYLKYTSSDYAYKQLGTQRKGTAKQTLYDRILEKAILYHKGTTFEETKDDIAFTVGYGDLKLSEDDVFAVWASVIDDFPLFYWISNTYTYYWSTGFDDGINILVDAEYASSEKRKMYNDKVYDAITEYINMASGETSAYQIALLYHDAIIKAIDYAYETDGITPEDALWAHNILGVFEKGSGVCESYAKTFQLLLNVNEIENVIVSGIGGDEENGKEDHLWNLIKLDDGEWYWCDLTWDDVPGWEWGIQYNYFCVNDTQNVNWIDSYDTLPSENFMVSHQPWVYMDGETSYKMTLPERAKKPYNSSDEYLVRDTFLFDGIEYSVIGYHALQVTKVTKTGKVVIPKTVTFEGVTYDVISIGARRDDGLFEESTTLADGISEVYLPESIQYIWMGALQGYDLEKIVVDDNNPYFTSLDGVLFTKSLYTLIQYPINKPKLTTYMIPDETVDIAFASMEYLRNPYDKLVLGANVQYIGVANWGESFHNEKPDEDFYGDIVDGELGIMMSYASYYGYRTVIEVHPSNNYYKVINNVLYRVDEKTSLPMEAVCKAKTDISDVIVEDTVIAIHDYAFVDCSKIRSIVLGAKIERIGEMSFDCPIKKITYKGTISQWNEIEKDEYWDRGSYNTYGGIEVECSDGIVPKQN